MFSMKLFIKIITEIMLISLSLESCRSGCKTCDENAENSSKDMKCYTCASEYYLIVNTSNCGKPKYFPDYYLNKTENKLYPCSFFKDSNCYECNPYLKNTQGICLSCNRGYKYDNITKECKKCEENEYPIIINDFENCEKNIRTSFCDKYITYCKKIENEEIICPDEAPIFDNLTKSCNEYECINSGIKKGICYPYYPHYNKYKDRILFINWLKKHEQENYVRYPNYLVDNSDLLLIELTCDSDFTRKGFYIGKTNKRKFYFYNEEGRGLFDEINDIYEKSIKTHKKLIRFFSSSIILKTNNSEKYRYFLNFEMDKYNLEFMDLKTGEFTYDNLFEIIDDPIFNHVDNALPWIQILKLNDDNKFLLCFYSDVFKDRSDSVYELKLVFLTFELSPTKNENIDIYSLELIDEYKFGSEIFDITEETRFFVIQTKNGRFFISIVSENNYLFLLHLNSFNNKIKILSNKTKLFNDAFHKLLFIKEEKFLLCYYPYENVPYYNNFIIKIYEYKNETLYKLGDFNIETEIKEGSKNLASDIIMLSDAKAAFIVMKWHGRRISIYIINFFDNYKYFIYNLFILKIYEHKMMYLEKYSLLFKYKDLLGLHFENIEAENGFILFGYFNSTDPKQIYNIKKDGLNYNINLGSYLTLQSNLFQYKKKCIKIIEIPDLNESGIFLISNYTKNIIKKGDCVNLNTEIKINFGYNGIIQKGNYLFKFCGVLEEATLEEIKEYSDEFKWKMKNENFEPKYINIYNEQRYLNITGKVALVQINVLNNTKIFCDDKYNNTAIKTKEGKYLTCGDGLFYDVENANEITQINLGAKYYYDINKKIYIKCHEKCKKCTRKYNDTNMNCDECYDNYFLRNGNCLEISKCEYNYYYDIDLNLKCISKDNYCPDFKPYENNKTKECIEKCNIHELNNNICKPTSNPISINETHKIILENTKYLNLSEKLLKNKEKYTINGNNVSFIFTTNEIEKKDLNNINNGSSIILNKCENIIKQKYLISKENSIPILKIEKLNNNSNNIDIFYELFNPNNLSEKIDLNLFSQNYIEIRLPLVLKPYKLNLVASTSKLGYNIFDLNDSFYNDICSIFTYNDSDFSLSERKTLLDLSDEILCISGCNFTNFDIKTLRTICVCKIGNDINNTNSSSEIKIKNVEEDTIFNKLKKKIDFSKTSNIKVVKCFLIIFNVKLFYENYGFYIMSLMTILNILLLYVTIQKNINKKLNDYYLNVINQMKTIYGKKQKEGKMLVNIDNNIENITTVDNKNIDIINNKEISINSSYKEDIKIRDNKEIIMENSKIDNINKLNFNTSKNETYSINNEIPNIYSNTYNKENNNKICIDISKNENSSEINDASSQRDIKTKIRKGKKYKSANNINPTNLGSTTIVKIKDDRTNSLNNLEIINNNETKSIQSEENEQKIVDKLIKKDNSDFYVFYVIKYIPHEERKNYISEYEIENLSYKYALKIEDRNKSDFYFSLLREKNKLISIFLNNKDFNIQTIKISLFLFNFNLSLTLNALFFNDEAIYQINQNDGSFNLSTQITRIIYSAIISAVLSFFVELLGYTHKSIIKLRNYKNIKSAEENISKLVRILKIKIISFFVITIFLDILFFYYITAFCSVYSIIQTHMITDSLMSFLLTNSYSIILSMIISFLRIFSMKKENKFRYLLYMISWIISLI